MSSRIVQSPASEKVEIVSDDDWLAATGAMAASLRQWEPARRPLFAALWNHGEYRDKHGRVTALWHDDATRKYGYGASQSAISGLIRETVVQPAIGQNMKGKRRYSVRLMALPESWYQRLEREWPAINGTTPATAKRMTPVEELQPPAIAPPELEDALWLPTVPPDEPLPEYAPPIQLEVASSVAMALLTQVVEIISSTSPAETDRRIRQLTDDLADASDKLARRLSENDQMRKSIRDLGEEIKALRYERDGLRKRLHAAEVNLERATNADAQAFVNARVQDELAKVMRATPVTRELPGDPK